MPITKAAKISNMASVVCEQSALLEQIGSLLKNPLLILKKRSQPTVLPIVEIRRPSFQSLS